MPSVPFISARVILDLAKGPHTPHRAAVRVLSPAQRSLLEEMIKLWLQQDIIEESASQWSFPIISVAKKRQAGQTTPQYQFCADLRVLNSKVLADSLFTGSVLANLALLEKHNIYTALDMWNAFDHANWNRPVVIFLRSVPPLVVSLDIKDCLKVFQTPLP